MSQRTAIILVDPYNEFLHPQGKFYPRVSSSLNEVSTVSRIEALVAGARAAKIPIYYAMHRQTREGDYDGWLHPTTSNVRIKEHQAFALGSFGAEYYKGLEPDFSNGDVVATEHWNSSGFENTNLNHQLQKHGIQKVVLAGMVANTCLEATARYAVELGYHVTMLTDATAGFTKEAYEAATTLIWPLFSHEVTTVDAFVESIQNGAPKT
ncbi:hypothetical protein PLICRDRAFT_40992 [Plicaturopsis crispa FD-325 SS-3]|nr:hypothetical protein PLICRDRAFT_40992 [Plicaturopsis crispa FD-325 SS-3]